MASVENSNPNAPIYLLRLNILQEEAYALSPGVTMQLLEDVLERRYTLKEACDKLRSIIADYKSIGVRVR
jgi:hypothetical protein